MPINKKLSITCIKCQWKNCADCRTCRLRSRSGLWCVTVVGSQSLWSMINVYIDIFLKLSIQNFTLIRDRHIDRNIDRYITISHNNLLVLNVAPLRCCRQRPGRGFSTVQHTHCSPMPFTVKGCYSWGRPMTSVRVISTSSNLPQCLI